ncbi:MAG TPA: phosphoenolpyruvate synthase [Candidatus Thalassarchaeaceae archaeon]|nr:phosphoenolpyruvate synthase [Candidatus Thalassarchaeaceae archaeon]
MGVDSNVLWFDEVGRNDALSVGGKGASLGEMYRSLRTSGVNVPNGFCTTSDSYREFVETEMPSGTWDQVIEIDGLENIRELAIIQPNLSKALKICIEGASQSNSLEMHGRAELARALVLETQVPENISNSIGLAYRQLCEQYGKGTDVAVRSSATTEDSEDASFAGQYESFLNIHGENNVIHHWRKCVASQFTERAICYQLDRGMDPLASPLCVVIMKMVRSDLSCSGVMFTIDPDSGHDGVVHIAASYGLGELIVQGTVSPDTYTVWKEGLLKDKFAIVHRHLGSKEQRMIYASDGIRATTIEDIPFAERRKWVLSSEECKSLANMAIRIENHYMMPMDIEWAKDGNDGELYIVQARPETVHGKTSHGLIRYEMDRALVEQLKKNCVLATGQAVGKRIGTGPVRTYNSYKEVLDRRRALQKRLADGEKMEDIPWDELVFEKGDVLVTEMTTPDWEPMMKNASLIITRKGGRTSHAAIIAREFGIPAIVGCADALKLENRMKVTGSCSEGDTGYIFEGEHPFEIVEYFVDTSTPLETKIKLNVGFPTKSLVDSQLPVDGVGLARIEFVLSGEIAIHPLAFIHYHSLKKYLDTGVMTTELEPFARNLAEISEENIRETVEAIERRCWNYEHPSGLFIDKLREGVGLICAAFYPRPVLVRLSDFKSNEYRDLLGGRIFEPVEENPMIAWRGASRYLDPIFKPAFKMECEALASVFYDFGLNNLQLMVPFCRSPEEGEAVKNLLEGHAIGPSNGVPLFVMVELPSNVIDADSFIDKMQLSGGSIGTNDLVQTVYAVSRDDLEGYQHQVDARAPAVRSMIRTAIDAFTSRGLEIGICGQAPSDYPNEFPPFLVECGISSISVTPDTAMAVRQTVLDAEAVKTSAIELED